ncbi:MAG: DUF2750 domain-containing protein [Candidatus Competibacteraceae bacterium]|nr:DUF2750 domain-containing protein [Candidatus Competibacteraceae bacterium]
MAYSISEKEIRNVARLSADERYDYFVTRVIDGGEVWSLRSEEGWVAVSSDDGECFPVWPHPDFAAQWATDDWSDCAPTPIPLEVWMHRWTPGLEQDGTLVAVFPNENEEGVVVSPGELQDSLERELGTEH